jgi:hypothetical protein
VFTVLCVLCCVRCACRACCAHLVEQRVEAGELVGDAVVLQGTGQQQDLQIKETT